jgi:hypothetical protein
MKILRIYNGLIIILSVFLIIIGCTNKGNTSGLRADITLPAYDQNIWEGDIIFFEGIASGGTPPYAYSWDFGKIMPQIKKKESGQVVFNYEGAYNVIFTVIDSKGDRSIDSVRIIVSPKS